MTITTGSIAFTDGTTTVNLPVLRYPQDLGSDRENIAIQRTSGGGRKSVDWGGGSSGRWFQRSLAMRLTADEYEELRDFIWGSTVNGPENAFTFTDGAGTDFDDVYYDGGLDPARVVANDQIVITLRLSRDETA